MSSMTPGPGDETQGLWINISAEDAGASKAFNEVLADFEAVAGKITGGNEKLGESALRAAQTMRASADQVADAQHKVADAQHKAADAATATAKTTVDANRAVEVSMKEVMEMRARMAAVDSAATEARRKYLDEVRREIEVSREMARTGEINAQQRLQQARETMQIPTSYGRISPGELREGALTGNADMAARYRAYMEATREVEIADKQLSDVMMSEARKQAEAIQDGVRLGTMSLGDQESALRAAQAQYAEYADARMLLDRKITENQIAQNREQQRMIQGQTREQERERSHLGSSASEALLNAGYMLPGPLGMAAVNMGYLGMGGPQAMAIGGAAMAGVGVGAGLYGLAETAGKDEEAMARLGQAVKDQGASWDALKASVDAWATAQARSTIFGRDETIPALRTMVNAGQSVADALKTVRVAEDAAAATGKPLQTVVEGLMHAYEGNARSLISLGIANKDQIKDGMEFGDVLVAIEAKMRDQATATDTLTEKQKRAKNASVELAREVGEGLVKAFGDATDAYTKYVTSIDGHKLGQQVGDMAKGTEDLATAWGHVLGALEPVYNLYKSIAGADIKLNMGLLGLTGAAIGAASNPTNPQTGPTGWGGSGTSPYDRVSGSALGPASAPINQLYGPLIAQYAAAAGIDPSLVAPLFAREDWSSNPAIRSPAGAIGLGQLMPGTAASLGVTDPTNPQQNIAGAIKYFAEQLKDFNGNLRLAYAAYNAGPGAVRAAGGDISKLPQETQDYVAYMMANQNAGPTNAMLRSMKGGASTGSPTSELGALEFKYGQEGRAGIESWRTDWENALAAVRDDDTKTMAERVAAQSKYNELVKQDAEEQKRASTDRERAAEAANALMIAREDDRRREGKETIAQEIANLERLKAVRAQSDDPRGAKDAEEIQRRIDTLTTENAAKQAKLAHDVDEAWKRALEHQIAFYKTGKESLDDFIRNVGVLEHSAGVSQPNRDRAAVVITNAQNAAAASDTRSHSETSSSASSDADDAVKRLADRYDELGAAIRASTSDKAVQDAQLSALAQREIADLERIKQEYKDTYGDDAQKAVARFDDAIAQVGKTGADAAFKFVTDQREQLQKAADDYKKFAETASDHLATIFQGGPKSLRETLKSALGNIEHDLLSSAIGGVLFPGAGPQFNPGADLQKAFFGTTAPTAPGGTMFGVSPQIATAAFTKLSTAPTGTPNDPLTVKLDTSSVFGLTGSPAGVLPGSPTAAASTGLGLSQSLQAAAGASGASSWVPSVVAAGAAGTQGGGAPNWITGALGLASGLVQPGSQAQFNLPFAQTVANAYGTAGPPNGSQINADPAVAKAFGTTDGYAGVQRLLALGPQAFMTATGLSAGQYQNYVQMFNGQPITQANYQNYAAAMQTIENALQTTQAGLPYNSYSLNRSGGSNTGSLSLNGQFYPILTTSSGGPGLSTVTGGSGLINSPAPSTAATGYLGSLTSGGSSGLPSNLLQLLLLLSLLQGGSGGNSGTGTGGGLLGGILSFLGGGGGGGGSASLPTISLLPADAASVAMQLLGGGSGSSIAGFGGTNSGLMSVVSALFGGGGAAGAGGGIGSLLSSGRALGGASGAGGLGSILSPIFNGGLASAGGLGGGLSALFAGGNPFVAGAINAGLAGIGLGMGINSLLGGNQMYGDIGSVLGSTIGLIGGPIGSLIGGALGGALGGLFGPHWGPASNYPDRSDTVRYGTILADLLGTNQANGQYFYEDPTIKNLFNGLTGVEGIGRLLAAGQTAFSEETGLSAAEYQQYLAMFGAGATGLNFPTSNVGIMSGNGQGASGTYTYLQYGQALQAIVSGLQASGATGPYDSYKTSLTYPSYGGASGSSGSGSGSGSGAAPGNGAANSSSARAGGSFIAGSYAAAGAGAAGSAGGYSGSVGARSFGIGMAAGGGGGAGAAAYLDLRNSIFVGSNNASAATLADVVNLALAQQARGSLPSAFNAPVRQMSI